MKEETLGDILERAMKQEREKVKARLKALQEKLEKEQTE